MAITPLPPAPLVTDSPAEFNTKAFTFVNALGDFVTETNALALEVDADATVAAEGAAASEAAVAAANFKGAWSSLSGALNIPASVSHNGSVYVLTANLADVTADEPGVTPSSKWIVVTIPPQVGNSGEFLTTNGTDLAWAAIPEPTIQEFTASGTWTKPADANFVMVEVWGGGGGGASGRRGASSGIRYGGGGGGGGAYSKKIFKASSLPSSLTITIGSGGAGGTAVTINDSGGTSGSDGGTTSFGTFLYAFGGQKGVTGAGSSQGGGGGGSLSTGSAINGGGPYGYIATNSYGGGGGGYGGAYSPYSEPSGSIFGGGGGGVNEVNAAGSLLGGGGGGGGGGLVSNVYMQPSFGGCQTVLTGSGGAAGTSANIPTAGSNGAEFQGGGGGGSSQTQAAAPGGNGGYAGGGGGGGASLNGFNSGAGGNGGNGLCRVYVW